MVLAVLKLDNFDELCAKKTCGNTVGERFSAVAYNLFSALSVKARDSPSTCCVETNIALLLACSNITVLATATTRTIHFFFFEGLYADQRGQAQSNVQ